MLLRQYACELIAARHENQDAGLKPGAALKPKARARHGARVDAAAACGK
jgi:hypothetical protein